MKDDSMQGVLFSKSHYVRFRQVPMPPNGLYVKSKKASKRLLEPLSFMRKRSKQSLVYDSEINSYIDYVVTE